MYPLDLKRDPCLVLACRGVIQPKVAMWRIIDASASDFWFLAHACDFACDDDGGGGGGAGSGGGFAFASNRLDS